MSRKLIIGHKGQLGSDCRMVFPEAEGVDFPDLDISNRECCLQVLNKLKPTLLVNCAAYTAVDACESDPACWKVNADGPKHLAEWAAANDAFMVHISTDYVFSGSKPLFHPTDGREAGEQRQQGSVAKWQSLEESEAPNPVSEYGRSKLAGERAVLESGAKAAILRTAWLYGANGKNFLKTMLRLALQDPEREIRVVNDQFGSPTWSHTLARQIKATVQAKATGVFHATSEGYCSWYQLADRFLSLMKVPYRMAPCTTAEYPTPARRPTNSILENARAKTLGINQFKDWKDDLEEFVHRHRNELLQEAEGLLK